MFFAGSLMVHLLIIALVYNASLLSFLDKVSQKPEAAQPLYVGLVEPEKPKPPPVGTVQPEPQPKVEAAKPPAQATVARPAAQAASRGEPMRSPAAKKEAVSEEDLKEAIPVQAGREEGVTVPIRGAEKATEGAAAQQESLLRVVQTRASTPGGQSKGIAKGNRRVDEGRQEFSQYSSAGKPLDVPRSQYARKAARESGDDPSAGWFQPKSLNSGGARLQAGSETGSESKNQPRPAAVSKAGQVAGGAAGEYMTAASLPGSRQSGPAQTELPRLTRMVYGPAPRPGQPGGAGPAEPVPAGITRAAGGEKQVALAGGGRAGIPTGSKSGEPRIGPRTISEAIPPAPDAAQLSVTITSPADKSEIDALRDKTVTITGEVRGQGFGSVRVHLNNAVYEASAVGGKFSLRVRMDSEENALFAEVTDDSGGAARSGIVKFRALNLFPKDLVVKAGYKGAGHPVLDCRFKVHPLYEKRQPGSAPPKFHIEDGANGGLAEVGSAPPGIYSFGAKCGPGSGAAFDAVFDVTLYGYDSGRKKVRRVGPVKLGEGVRAAPVRVLIPEGVFWDDDSWFSGIIEGGNGTIKYKEPDGLVWKEQDR